VLGDHPQLAMIIGAVLALAWGWTGGWLGRRQRQLDASAPASPGAPNTPPPLI